MSDNRQIPLTHHRCLGRNYSARGIYLITLCTEHRRPLLGELCGDTAAQAHIRPTELGRAVLRCWYDIPAFHKERAVQKSLRTGRECRREIQIITSQLMPDHFHGIIFIKEDMDISLGQVIAGFMKGCTKAFHRMLAADICCLLDMSPVVLKRRHICRQILSPPSPLSGKRATTIVHCVDRGSCSA